MKCVRCKSWPCSCSDGITLICGDVRDVAPAIDITAAMILADPPYGETSIDWDRWPDRWVSAMQSVSSRSTSFWCFGSARMFLEHQAEFCFWRFVQDVVWEKHNGSGFLVDRFRRVHESIYHFVPAGAKWETVFKNVQYTNDATARTVRKKEKPPHWHGKTGATTYVSKDGGPRMMRSVWQVRSQHGKAQHPTEKPVATLTPLIDYSCPQDGIVFVPFAGSGSELVAAKQCGRKAIGVEVSSDYCATAAARLSQSVMMFD